MMTIPRLHISATTSLILRGLATLFLPATMLLPTTTLGTEPQESNLWRTVTPFRSDSVVASETARVLEDGSVKLQGDAAWSEATLHFQRRQLPTPVQRVRVEILPARSRSNDKPLSAEPPTRLSRTAAPLWLFEIKATHKTGAKHRFLDWKSCRSPQLNNDESLPNCIDYLTDTGIRLPTTNRGCGYELLLELREPLVLQDGEHLLLTLDSGGGPDLGVLARVRISVPRQTKSKR